MVITIVGTVRIIMEDGIPVTGHIMVHTGMDTTPVIIKDSILLIMHITGSLTEVMPVMGTELQGLLTHLQWQGLIQAQEKAQIIPLPIDGRQIAHQ